MIQSMLKRPGTMELDKLAASLKNPEQTNPVAAEALPAPATCPGAPSEAVAASQDAPTPEANNQVTDGPKPAATNQVADTSGPKPAATDQVPDTSGPKPAATDQVPDTSGPKPAAPDPADAKPTTIKEEPQEDRQSHEELASLAREAELKRLAKNSYMRFSRNIRALFAILHEHINLHIAT